MGILGRSNRSARQRNVLNSTRALQRVLHQVGASFGPWIVVRTYRPTARATHPGIRHEPMRVE